MYTLHTRKDVDKTFKRLSKKNPKQLEIITKKLKQVLRNPYRYKNLKAPLQHLRRVHFGSFVLTFSIDEKRKTVILEDYRHHDKIYKIK